MNGSASPLALDHLVVVAATLDEGVRWCEATLGITPGAGGRHALMGTHNRLFSVASPTFPKAYFEIIAVDPEAPAPGRARWFGMDAAPPPEPRLLHWVARCSPLDWHRAAFARAGHDIGPAVAAQRDMPAGPLRWRITVRDDGRLLGGGALPTLIEWEAAHPAESMPQSGVTLEALTLRGLDEPTAALLRAPGVEWSGAPGAAIVAALQTPRGAVTLSSSLPLDGGGLGWG